MNEQGKKFLGTVLEVLFPGRCLLCGDWLLFSGEGLIPVCGACLTKLSPLSGERCGICSQPIVSEQGTCTRCREMQYCFQSNLSIFEYRGMMRELIFQYKFKKRRRVGLLLSQWAAQYIVDYYPGVPIVPVPPRPKKRGTDHVEIISGLLERQYGLRVVRILERTGGVAQKILNFEERSSNLQGKIRVKSGKRLSFPRVVLFDDIFTTGATADTCAQALVEAGVGIVSVLTIAIDL